MKQIYFILIFFSFNLLLYACHKGKNNTAACNGNSTRRDIKLVIDDLANEIDTIPVVTTIDSLGSIEIGDADSDTKRLDIEKHVFTVTGKVDKVKKYRDGDYKVKLISENEKYLNCEVPNPGCAYAQDSPFKENFTNVRAFIVDHLNELEGKTVTITGIAFRDIDHPYPRNAAENEIELHPILSIGY